MTAEKDFNYEAKSLVKHSKEESSELSVYSMLREYVKEEQLGKDDMWYCNKCKEHVMVSHGIQDETFSLFFQRKRS